MRKFLLLLLGRPYVEYSGGGMYCVRARESLYLGYVSPKDSSIRITCWPECRMSLEEANKLLEDTKNVGQVISY